MPEKSEAMNRRLAAAAAALLLLLPGCSSRAVKNSLYETLYQSQCMEKTGAPNCDRQHQSYEDYSRQRQELLKRHN